jgi:hypothetical protein
MHMASLAVARTVRWMAAVAAAPCLCACHTLDPTHYTDSGAALAIECAGPGGGWSQCETRAAQQCPAGAYSEILRLGDTIERMDAASPVDMSPDSPRRTLIVECTTN